MNTKILARVGWHTPSVAIALNNPFATRSISSSICCSVDDGELRIAYVVAGMLLSMAGGWLAWMEGAGVGGGNNENSEGDGAMKARYWSMTFPRNGISLLAQE